MEMDKQKYESKSFIISVKSHKDEEPSWYNPYEFRCGSNWHDSVIGTMLSNKLWFQEHKEKTESNDDKETELEEHEKSVEHAWYSLRIVIHSHKDLSIGQVSYEEDVASFAQEFFPNPQKNNKEHEAYLPIVHLTLDDSYVDNLYSEVNVPLPPHISRSYQILDSSIWNKIVPFDRNDIYKVGGVRGLYQVIQEIDLNYQRGLYSLEVTHEYANLNARLAKQAFLSGTHANGVSPFIFHSESAISFLIKRELCREDAYSNKKKSISDRIAQHKWRILLVDDKVSETESDGLSKKKEALFKVNDRDDNLPWNSKLAIIKNVVSKHFEKNKQFSILHRLQESKIEKEDGGILIDYAKNIDAAKTALKSKEYDLILLDYLLDNDAHVEYGYELLEEVYNYQEVKRIFDTFNKDEVITFLRKAPTITQKEEIIEYAKRENNLKEILRNQNWTLLYDSIKNHLDDKNNQYKIGPHGRFFFMFISAYSTAVYERLLAEGLNRSEKYWHIAVGACPTNTPNLFLYNLLKLMEKQLEDSGVDKLSAQSIYDVVHKIYGEAKGEDVGKTVRHRANKYYQKVLDMHYHYRKMLDDVHFPDDEDIYNTKGSVLITNFIKNEVNLGGFLEHLTQLVHLTAFGTVRQWPEMWEEYIYFKSLFNTTQFNNDDKFRELCVAIENHIRELKSNME